LTKLVVRWITLYRARLVNSLMSRLLSRLNQRSNPLTVAGMMRQSSADMRSNFRLKTTVQKYLDTSALLNNLFSVFINYGCSHLLVVRYHPHQWDGLGRYVAISQPPPSTPCLSGMQHGDALTHQRLSLLLRRTPPIRFLDRFLRS